MAKESKKKTVKKETVVNTAGKPYRLLVLKGKTYDNLEALQNANGNLKILDGQIQKLKLEMQTDTKPES